MTRIKGFLTRHLAVDRSESLPRARGVKYLGALFKREGKMKVEKDGQSEVSCDAHVVPDCSGEEALSQKAKLLIHQSTSVATLT